MTSKVFISYRRGDDAGYAHALHAILKDHIDPQDIFMDVQGDIKPGDSFADVIDSNVRSSDVMLAIIGRRWLELLNQDRSGGKDWVLAELNRALELGKRVIPVLVDRAEPPRRDQLPPELGALAGLQAIELRPTRFSADAGQLVTFLVDQLGDHPSEPVPENIQPGPPDAARPRKALAILGLFIAIGGATGAGIFGYNRFFAGDYASCIAEAAGAWEGIRSCAEQYEFPL